MKRPWQSKTLWANLIIALGALLIPGSAEWIRGHPEISVLLQVAINFALRLVTKEKIEVKPTGNIIGGLMLLLMAGCSTGFELRNDPNPSPIDHNYHTMLMQTSCSPSYSFGQAGCSLAPGEDLANHWLRVATPLGGSLAIHSTECGVDRKEWIEKGGVIQFALGDLIPPQTSFCTFSLYSFWQKPEGVESEVEVRGQSGKFYIKIRSEGAKPAKLGWTPPQGMIHEQDGMLFAQFREIAGLPYKPPGITRSSKSVTTLAAPGREPILLQIEATEPTSNGLYQIWSEAKQIGIKEQAFTGDSVEIHRSKILGNQKKGSFLLDGWMVGQEGLDNEFSIAIDIFGVRVVKLAANVYLTETEICWDTESTVSLIVLSTSDTLYNETSMCVEKPKTDAILGFFTNVGRAGYAVYKDGKLKWIQ